MPAEVTEGESAQMTTSPATPPPTPRTLGGVTDMAAEPLLTPMEEVTTPKVLPARCLNCRAELAGPFCAQCGQHVADYHHSIWKLLTTFFDSVFSWHSKFFRTLVPLLTRPGLLTVDFLSGRRARYVHPLRLFLFTSAVCLFLLQLSHRNILEASSEPKGSDGQGDIHFNFGDDDENADAKPSPKPAATPVLPDASGSLPMPASAPNASPSPTEKASPSASSSPSASPKKKKRDPDPENAFENAMEKVGKRLENKTTQLGRDEFNRQLRAKMQSSLSWVALTILPVFALMVRTMYWRRDSYYFDHLIFSLHYHTFLLMLMTAYRGTTSFIDATHLSWLKIPLAFALLIPPWYLYQALKRLFAESRRRTIVKVIVIGVLHFAALVIGITVVSMGSILSLV